MSSDDRAKHSEPGAWTPPPRTLDLEAREIDPEASEKSSSSTAGGGHGESAAGEPASCASKRRRARVQLAPCHAAELGS